METFTHFDYIEIIMNVGKVNKVGPARKKDTIKDNLKTVALFGES